MLSFLGYLLVFAAIILTVISPYLLKKNNEIDKENGKKPPYLNFLTLFDFKLRAGLFGLGLLMLLLAESVIFAKEGHQYYILSPTGARSTIMSPGIKFIVPFSKIQEWEKFIDIKCVALDKKGNYKQDVTGIEGVIPNGINVRFIDKVDANVKKVHGVLHKYSVHLNTQLTTISQNHILTQQKLLKRSRTDGTCLEKCYLLQMSSN